MFNIEQIKKLKQLGYNGILEVDDVISVMMDLPDGINYIDWDYEKEEWFGCFVEFICCEIPIEKRYKKLHYQLRYWGYAYGEEGDEERVVYLGDTINGETIEELVVNGFEFYMDFFIHDKYREDMSVEKINRLTKMRLIKG
jgi:hypothetical protein